MSNYKIETVIKREDKMGKHRIETVIDRLISARGGVEGAVNLLVESHKKLEQALEKCKEKELSDFIKKEMKSLEEQTNDLSSHYFGVGALFYGALEILEEKIKRGEPE